MKPNVIYVQSRAEADSLRGLMHRIARKTRRETQIRHVRTGRLLCAVRFATSAKLERAA